MFHHWLSFLKDYFLIRCFLPKREAFFFHFHLKKVTFAHTPNLLYNQILIPKFSILNNLNKFK